MSDLAARLVTLCAERGLTLTTAESCTGGLLASAIVGVPGASAVLGAGFITYSNAAKISELGVPPELLEASGAVSEPVASEMAAGARRRAGADLAVAITGIAGPGGGSPAKPVGTVCFAIGSAAGIISYTKHFSGDRDAVRAASVTHALTLLLDAAR